MRNGKVFDLDEVHYADAIEKDGWKVRFRLRSAWQEDDGRFLDIYGNEARMLIDAAEFGKANPPKKTSRKKK